ncbi:MAG TPA: hypothetical protein VGE70_02550 [Burkholderiaceae bacterium]
MRTFLLFLASAMVALAAAHAQERVYRCGNEYTNNPAMAKNRDCKVLDGGNVTVIQGTRVQQPGASRAAQPSGGQRVASDEQRARDTDSRAILESELRRAESRQAELLKEFNNGEPEKQGAEGRNYQKYLDRVEEMRAGIARGESDIAGLKRELARLGAVQR